MSPMKPLETRFQPSYEPGIAIEISGIYRIRHDLTKHHVAVIDVVCEKGGVFPKCRQCTPTFILMHRYAQLSDIFPSERGR